MCACSWRLLALLVLLASYPSYGEESAFERVLHRSGAYSTYHTLPKDMQRASDGSEALLEQCSMIQMQYIGRHGTRYPFDHMVTKYEQIGRRMRGLAAAAGSRLPSWTAQWSFQPFLGRGSAGDLHEGGERELYSIAKRLKDDHPGLAELFHFAEKVGPLKSLPVGSFGSNQYRVRSSQYVHTARSADALAFAFMEGQGGIGSCADSAGGAGGYQPIYVESDTTTARRLTAYTELKLQCQTASMLQHAREDSMNAKERLLLPIAERLTRAWGVGSSYNVTASDVNHFFSLCAFEMEIAGITDQFCALFTEEERSQWQLYCDVSSYNEFGYGFLPYAETGAVVLQDVYAAMSAAVKGKSYAPRSVLHVGHRQTLLTLTATLGLYREPNGVAPNAGSSQRRWRTNDIAPFAGNFVFLLYDCSDSPHIKVDAPEEAYFLRVLHNERDADLPQAQKSTAIPYSAFWAAYSEALRDSLDAICLRHTGQHVKVDTLADASGLANTEGCDCPTAELREMPEVAHSALGETQVLILPEEDQYLLEQCGSVPLLVFASGLLTGVVALISFQKLGLAASCGSSTRRRLP